MKHKIYTTLVVLFLTLCHVNGQTTCENNVNVNNTTVTNALIIQSDNTITSSGSNVIENSATVQYRAGADITLSSNFDISNGAAFDALIRECNPTPYNDPYLALQWGHYENINSVDNFNSNPINTNDIGQGANIFGAWETTKGSSTITVAILDSGIDMSHVGNGKEFSTSRIVDGYNFVGDNENYDDILGHGTLVTGILGATPNNGKGVAGIDWNCKIIPIKIQPTTSETVTGNIEEAPINYAIEKGANIISMSYGINERLSIDVEAAYRNAIDNNVLLIAAAGNDNRATDVDYPARYPSIIGVGALSPCDERKSSVTNNSGSCDQDTRSDLGVTNWGSNYGEGLDFLAPGTLLPSTDVHGILAGYSGIENPNSEGEDLYNWVENGNYILDTYGTSMSSPFAAGIASLIWSVNSDLKNYQVRHLMQVTARNIGNTNETGAGALDAKKAVQMAKSFKDKNRPYPFVLPNLSLDLVSITTDVKVGDDFVLKYRLKNTGDKVIQINTPIKLSYGTSQNALNTVDIDVSGLLPNNTTDTLEIILPTPCDRNPRSFSLYVNIDTDYDVTESNEFNTYRYPFRTYLDPNPMPDIIINNAIISGTVNNNYTISYTIKNIGNIYFSLPLIPIGVPLHRFYKFYASEDSTYNENIDIEIGVDTTNRLSLCPQNSYSVISDLFIPPNTNYLIIKVDPENTVIESNENNNTYAINLQSPAAKFVNKNIVEVPIPFALTVIPNPITHKSIIHYELQKESNVTASIYNIYGREVLPILKLSKQQKGNYNYPIKNTNLTTGIYFLEVTIDGTKHIKKLIVE